MKHLILILVIIPSIFSVETTVKSSVSLYVRGTNRVQDIFPLGSGFFIDNKGSIATNHHVVNAVENNDTIVVKTHDLRLHVAKVIKHYSQRDLSIIKIDSTEYPPVKFGSLPKKGDVLYAFGTYVSTGLGYSELRVGALGINLAPRPELKYENMIQLSGAVNSGTSGAALFNTKGEAVGIVTATSIIYDAIGFAIDINILRRFIPSNGDMEDRDIPFYITNNSGKTEADHVYGARILKGFKNLERSDVILYINENRVIDKFNVYGILQTELPNPTKITVLRNSKIEDILVSF